MNVLDSIPPPPRKIRKTQLNLDEAISLVLYLCALFFIQFFADFSTDPFAMIIVKMGASIFLLYAIKSIKVEKIVYLSLPMIFLGALAKLEHWWWASTALMLGFCFLLLSIIYIGIRYRRRIDQRLILLGLAVFLIANLAKLEHWFWASTAYWLGALLIILGAAYRFYLKEDKNVYDLAKLAIMVIFPLSGIAQLEHLPWAAHISILSFGILLSFTFLSFVDIFKNRIFTT